MKKALSIILIAAAAFGFYGGAVDIGDVLDCRDYWKEQGEISDENLDKLEDGLNQLEENTAAYVDGKAQLAEGEAELAEGKADYEAAPAKLAAEEEKLDAAEQQLSAAKIQLAAAKTQLEDGKTSIDGLETLIEGCETVITAYETSLDGTNPGWKTIYAMLNTPEPTADNLNATQQIIAGIASNKDSLKAMATFLPTSDQNGYVTALEAVASAKEPETAAQFKTLAGNLTTIKSGMDTAVVKLKQITDDATCAQVVGAAKSDFNNILTQVGGDAGIATIEGYSTKFGTWLSGYAGLVQGQAEISSGIKQICQAFVGTETLRQGVMDAFGTAKGTLVIAKFTICASDASPLFTQSFDKYRESMEDETLGLINLLKQAKSLLQETKASATAAYNTGLEQYNAGLAEYNAGLKEYNAGLKEYKEGLADYKAAPAKLADGEAQVAEGRAKLAEYEDGEAQLKDGLKDLMETEAEGGLKSIAARVGEDEDFIADDGLIDFMKAMFGVEQGRDYSADSSAAITPELTNRAIAAGVGIAAAALALIAAFLGMANKRTGAGICGILAAIAGAVAVFMTKSAGTTWTVLAGSTLGAIPVIAFGVVAVAGLIFALAQLGAKEE